MNKNIITLLLATSLVACATTDDQAMSAKDQVAGASKMCADNAEAIEARQQEKPLYIRLGEREGITQFSKNLYAAHKANSNIGHMFANVPEQPFLNNVVELVVTASGGKGSYTGRDMATVHKDLGITHQDFLDAGADVQSVMKGLGYGDNEIQEVVCMLVSQVPQVVTR